MFPPEARQTKIFYKKEGVYSIKKIILIENIKVKPHPNTGAVEISWGGLYDCEKIYNFLYNDANIFLKRKLDKLDKILCLGQYEV